MSQSHLTDGLPCLLRLHVVYNIQGSSGNHHAIASLQPALAAPELPHTDLCSETDKKHRATAHEHHGVFPLADQQAIRSRLAKAFRFIVSQGLVPRKDEKGRIAAIEVLRSTMRTREYVEKGESEGKSLLDAMRDGSNEGMQHFDGELNKFVREGRVGFETALGFATNAGNFRLEMQDYLDDSKNCASRPVSPDTEPDLEP